MRALDTLICIVVTGLCITTVEAYSCYSCREEVDKPSDCDHRHDCDHYCVTELKLAHHGEKKYKLHCEHECETVHLDPAVLVGRRSGNEAESSPMVDIDDPHGEVLCRSCCHSGSCQLSGCSLTPHVVNGTTLDVHVWVHEPDTTTASTQSTPSTTLPTTTTKVTTKATPTTKATSPTDEPSVIITETEKPVSHVPTSTQSSPVTHSNTLSSCYDIEHLTFSCDQWKSLGFCDATYGAGHIIALENCRKTCGYCH